MMPITRRQAVAAVLVTPLVNTATVAAGQEIGTPGVISNGTGALIYVLESTSPIRIAELLVASTVDSPLRPANIGALQLSEGDDGSEQHATVVARLDVVTGADPVIVGRYVVYRDRTAAIGAIETQRAETDPTDSIQLGAFGGLLWSGPDGPIALVQAGQLVIWGWGVPQRIDQDTVSTEGPYDDARFELQAMSNAIALLDHLNTVITT